MPLIGYARNIERLSAVVLNARQHDKRDLRTFSCDYLVDILKPDPVFPLPGPNFKQRVVRVETMKPDL